MECVATVCSSSLRRMWQATISKCFVSHDPLEEQESVAMVLLKGELVEAQNVVHELKVAADERVAAHEITKQHLMAAEEKIAEAQKERENFRQQMEEKIKELKELKEAYSKMERQVEEVIKNPCSCFFLKHMDSYLYAAYVSDEEPFLTMEEPAVPRTICDTNGFLPEDEYEIQLSGYEYSDDSADSNASMESTSSKENSDRDVRYINTDETESEASSESDEATKSTESSEYSDEDTSDGEPSARRIPRPKATDAALETSQDDEDDDEDLWWHRQ